MEKMNKKGDVVGIILSLGIIVVGFYFLLFITAKFQYNYDIRNCEEYNSYGYITESTESFWDVWNGKPSCIITMEDGTRLPLRDYKTMAIKNARVKT